MAVSHDTTRIARVGVVTASLSSPLPSAPHCCGLMTMIAQSSNYVPFGARMRKEGSEGGGNQIASSLRSLGLRCGRGRKKTDACWRSREARALYQRSAALLTPIKLWANGRTVMQGGRGQGLIPELGIQKCGES